MRPQIATKLTGGERPVGKRPVGKRPVGKRPMGKNPMGKRPVGKKIVGKRPPALQKFNFIAICGLMPVLDSDTLVI